MIAEFLQFLREILLCFGRLGGSFPPPLSAEEEKDCIERLAKGDMQARNRLVECNLRFVAHIARKFSNTGMDMDDLVSIGSIGLIKAVNTYSPQKGSSLATYAARCIENEILMSLRAARNRKVECSLNEPIGIDGEGNEMTLSDVLGTEIDAISTGVENKMEYDRIQKAMTEVLTSQEIKVIRMRFGLGRENKHTQREVGRVLGVSRSYVSRIEKRALERLAKRLGQNDG